MAVLHIHRTLTDGRSDDVTVADELNGDSSSPTRRSEVIGVHGRVQEMVLKFSMPDNGEWAKKAGRPSWSPQTTNGLVSPPTGTTGAQGWRSPTGSPVSAYRTGWMPPCRTSPPQSAPTSAPSQQRRDVCGTRGPAEASPSSGSRASRLTLNLTKSEQPSTSPPTRLLLKIDSAACGRQDVISPSVKDHTPFTVPNGHTSSRWVNGCSHDSSSSFRDECGGQLNAVLGSGDKSECSSSSSLDATLPGLQQSTSSSGPVVETSSVETVPAISDGSERCGRSAERTNSAARVAVENDETVLPCHTPSPHTDAVVVANHGTDPEPREHGGTWQCRGEGETELVDERSEDVRQTTDADLTQHISTVADSNHVQQPSSDDSSASDMHRDSDLLLSARRTSVDYFQKDGRYFLQLVHSVEDRINALCVQAEADMNLAVPEEALGKLRAAVGKAHLLTSKKFQQFRELCHKNLTQDAKEQFQTTSQDLAGFWDLVMIQVDDVRLMFAEIEQLRQNAWKEPSPLQNRTAPLSQSTARQSHSSTGGPLSPRRHASSAGKSKTGQSRDPVVKSEAAKAREEARKRLLAAKAAGRQRKASESDTSDVQIFIS